MCNHLWFGFEDALTGFDLDPLGIVFDGLERTFQVSMLGLVGFLLLGFRFDPGDLNLQELGGEQQCRPPRVPNRLLGE